MARKMTQQKGIRTVCFNMRGVKKSTGSPTICGCAEVHDVEAVLDWTKTNFRIMKYI
eukprot:UN13266